MTKPVKLKEQVSDIAKKANDRYNKTTDPERKAKWKILKDEFKKLEKEL